MFRGIITLSIECGRVCEKSLISVSVCVFLLDNKPDDDDDDDDDDVDDDDDDDDDDECNLYEVVAVLKPGCCGR